MGGTRSKTRTSKGLQRWNIFGSGRNCSTFTPDRPPRTPPQTRAALRFAPVFPENLKLFRLCSYWEAAMSSAQIIVELTEAQLLNAWLQAKRDLDGTLDDIARERGVEGDAIVKRSLYSVLSKAVYARPRDALKGGAA